MGENTVTHMMKVSFAGTSLKESEKNFYEPLCNKNNSQFLYRSRITRLDELG